MNTTHHQRRTGQSRLATGFVCVAAGLTAGLLATTVATGPAASETAPARTTAGTDQTDPVRFGSPGHITMSADAIEHWVLHGLDASAGAGRCTNPAPFGSPGHITMSADVIEHWIIHSCRAPG